MQQDSNVESDIRAWCKDYLAKTLKLPPERIDPNARFARLGLDSASSVFLLAALEEWLGVDLPAEVVFEHQTIADLARYLSSSHAVQTTLAQRAR